jgi:hypothetical protein
MCFIHPKQNDAKYLQMQDREKADKNKTNTYLNKKGKTARCGSSCL